MKRTVRLTLAAILSLVAAKARAQSEPSIVVNGAQTDERMIAISDDGEIAATGSIQKICLWSAREGRLLGTLAIGGEQIALSPDGQTLEVDRRSNIDFYRTSDRAHLSSVSLSSSEDDQPAAIGFMSPDVFLIREGARVSKIDVATGARSDAGQTNPHSEIVVTDGGWAAIERRDLGVRIHVGASAVILPVSNVEWVAVSSRNNRALVGGLSGASLWDTKTKTIVATYPNPVIQGPGAISRGIFSPDGETALLVRTTSLDVVKAVDGARKVEVAVTVSNEGYDPLTQTIAVANGDPIFAAIDNRGQAAVWSGRSGQLSHRLGVALSAPTRIVSLAQEGQLLIGGPTLSATRWDSLTGTASPGDTHAAHSLVSDKAGQTIAWQDDDGNIVIRRQGVSQDASIPRERYATARDDRRISRHMFKPDSSCDSDLAMTSDGKYLYALSRTRLTRTATATPDLTVVLLQAQATWAEWRCLALSPDESKLALSLDGAKADVAILDAHDGHFIRGAGGGGHFSEPSGLEWSPSNDALLMGEKNGNAGLIRLAKGRAASQVVAIGPNVDMSGFQRGVFFEQGASIAIASGTGEITTWDVGTVAKKNSWHAHDGPIVALTTMAGLPYLVTAGEDRLTRIWTASGTLVATVAISPLGEWLAITPKGYFHDSTGATDLLSVVDGARPYAIEQFFETLARQDLLTAALGGDAQGLYQDAASKQNLRTIIDSGPAPQLERLPGTETSQNSARITVRITDAGGGIGSHVIWRVNGVTQGDLSMPANPAVDTAGSKLVTRVLKIDPSQRNVIEVIAFNRQNLLASLPLRLELDKYGETTSRPKIHLLAVGISRYENTELNLDFAAADAESVAASLKRVAAPLYIIGAFRVLTEKQGRVRDIEQAINEIAAESQPQDVFVLYLAGHGRSIEGSFYFIQQDLVFGSGRTIVRDAISQDMLQTWLARIPATKSLVILDTCESSDLARNSTNSETALERLQHATGRSVITASSTAAREGYQGHGLLTGTMLNAFMTGAPGDLQGEITLQRLANFLYNEVPRISQAVWGIRQQPHLRISDDFPLGVLDRNANVALSEPPIPSTSTHVLVREESLRELPNSTASVIRTLPAGYTVRLVRLDGDFAVVARDGVILGYLSATALTALQ